MTVPPVAVRNTTQHSLTLLHKDGNSELPITVLDALEKPKNYEYNDSISVNYLLNLQAS